MVSLFATTDTCSTTAGSGFATTWTLSGSTTAYSGSLSTDGYQLKAGMTWKNGANATLTTDSISTGSVVGIGTCVETLDSAGAAVTTTDTTVGNFAVCHFLFYATSASGNSGTISNAYTGTHWGLTTYMTAAQWYSSSGSTAGAGVIGSAMNTSTGGTGLTSGTNGLVFDPTTVTNFVESTVYNMQWYQPSQATTYASTTLRRYSGAYNGATADKVKAYCVSQRLIATTTNYSAGIVAAAAAVTLSGATALAAGAVAFGVAALAM
jgi:hypothetical protein